jgi:glycosyltransferase involved in cell wall biosynthesis
MTGTTPDAHGTADVQGALATRGLRPLRVLHFVSGGFSGATQVALTLVRAARGSATQQATLVLRRKRHTDPDRIDALRAEGLPVETVPGWSHPATVLALAALCRRLQADVLVAHGFSEHLWGRYAGLLAGVPALVHVEHNSRERYGRWRLAQARWLAQRTARIVGCSEGVKQVLLGLGFPPAKVMAISNGIELAPFDEAAAHPLAQRVPGIVMAARFSRQKDHDTLVRALALLRERDLAPPLLLAGAGSAAHRERVQRLVAELGLQQQVQFLGLRPDVPQLLMQHRVCALSSHYEGMPLALVEGMAAGCAVVGSAVPGIRELLQPGRNGLLAPEGDAAAWADALHTLLTDTPLAEALADAARTDAREHHSLQRMTADYEAMLLSLPVPRPPGA